MRHILYILLLCFSAVYASAQCTPVISSMSNAIICSGNPLHLWSSPGDTYQWYLNGTIIAGANDDTYITTTPGDYTVEIDSSGCIAMSAVVTVTEDTFLIPGPITASNDIFCEGTTQTFSIDPVPGASFYTWHDNNMYEWEDFQDDSTNVASVVAGPSQGPQGQMVISVYAYNDCGASQPATKNVISHSPPVIGGHDWETDKDFLSNSPAAYCPTWGTERLYPVTHGAVLGYTSPFTYQWYEGNNPIPGETGRYLYINRGGAYAVKLITQQCGTFTIPKHVHQNVPSSATITPQGPLNFCQNNAQPLYVSFDMTGVDGQFDWVWTYGYGNFQYNIYSIIPDTSGHYIVWGKDDNPMSGLCQVMYPSSGFVTIPPPLEVTQTDDTLFATPGYDTYQWYKSGTLLPGETNQKLVLTVDGFYSVQGVFMNGCVENSASFDSDFMPPPPPEPPLPPGTNPQEPDEQLTVSPNPVSGSFVLSAKIAPGDNKATIIITDATGRMMFEKEIDVVDGIVEEKIDLGDASAQVGIIKLRSASTLKTTRFFKK